MLSNIIRRQAQTCKLGGPLCRTAFSASRSLSSRAVAFQKPAQAITARFAQFSTSLPSQDLSSVPSAGVSSLTARTLFIGNLPRRYRSDALKSELEKRGGAVAHLKLRNGTSWGHVEFSSEKDAKTVLEACIAKPFHFLKKDIRIEAATDSPKQLEPSQWVAVRGFPLDTAPQTVADLFGVRLEKVTMYDIGAAYLDLDSVSNATPVVEAAGAEPKHIGNNVLSVEYVSKPPAPPTNELHYVLPIPGARITELREAFSNFKDTITGIRTIAPNKGFITFNSTETAVQARETMNGKSIASGKVILTFPTSKRNSTPPSV